MTAYHGLADVERALSIGILAGDDPSYGCAHGPHICLAERPEVAANFGTVLQVDVDGLPVVWELGEGRAHIPNIPPWRLAVLAHRPTPDWSGWQDPALRVNHVSCLARAPEGR